MSEYSCVAFRAFDWLPTNRDLGCARRQSPRAEIDHWYFQNEYHVGEFPGGAESLLRHGYDVHLHYGDVGIRRIAFRLPSDPRRSTFPLTISGA